MNYYLGFNKKFKSSLFIVWVLWLGMWYKEISYNNEREALNNLYHEKIIYYSVICFAHINLCSGKKF